MKIITRAVLDWHGNVLEEDSYEYSGSITTAKSAGSAPQPTNPYTQADAEYGLSTGTANYNAALNRTGVSNPLGSSSWNVTGYSGSPTGTSTTGMPSAPSPSSPYGLGGTSSIPGFPTSSYAGAIPNGSGAPLYTQSTSLQPWADSLLSSPIDTSQIPGMPGGPSLEQNVTSAENATYGQEEQLLQPQEAEQAEQTQSQLEAEGAMPGSAAYSYGENMLGLTQGEENTNAANQAVTTGMGELPTLYGLGTTSLNNQIAERSAPISEFEGLEGNAAAATASTPDISSAFTQQLQAALGGYNANVATNNATTSAIGGLGSAALLAALL